jgi:hypothetical protein
MPPPRSRRLQFQLRRAAGLDSIIYVGKQYSPSVIWQTLIGRRILLGKSKEDVVALALTPSLARSFFLNESSSRCLSRV